MHVLLITSANFIIGLYSKFIRRIDYIHFLNFNLKVVINAVNQIIK